MTGESGDRRTRSAQPGGRFHGRGRPLRPGLKALLQDRLPALSVTLPAEPAEFDPHALFAAAGPGGARAIWLEIGFGNGEHLAWQAERNRGVGFVGVEWFRPGIARLLRRIDERNLDNVRIYEGDGRDLLAALSDRSLDRAFVLFPDPWPKTRHHKRRFIDGETLGHLARVLRDGAELRLATDHMGYARWILARMSGRPEFRWLARRPTSWRERPADWPATRYESKARAQGRAAIYLRYRRQRSLV